MVSVLLAAVPAAVTAALPAVLVAVLPAVLVAVLVAGCAPADGSTAPASTSGAAAPSSPSAPSSGQSTGQSTGASGKSSASAAVRTLQITVTGTDIRPPPGRVDLPVGSTLRLEIAVDHADVLHVHGFEIERAIRAGTPVSVSLTGREPGVYAVELHDPELLLTRLVVQ